MAPPTSPEPGAPNGADVVAAGAVVTRKGPEGREVLLVHRPKYDDWSFPKGKQDPGEHVTATAVREVVEETGVEIRLGRTLRPQLYNVSGGRAKIVHYWVGHVVGDDDLSTYQTNDEVDDLGWFLPDDAARSLTYLDDIALLDQFRESPKNTAALIVVRHAKALKRSAWDGTDALRPLADAGLEQAQTLRPLLHAYGVSRVLSSSSTRCLQTLQPYADEQVIALEEVDELSEEGFDDRAAGELMALLMESPGAAVLCSHRPVLPRLFEILGVSEEPLSPSELVVAHHRRGAVVATERHLVP